MKHVGWLVVLAVLLLGCGEQAPSDGGDGGDRAEEPSVTRIPDGPRSDEPTGAVAVAVADLAERLGIAEGDVEVVSQEEVTWRDGSIGCAEPGMAYTQALVPGERIVLAAGGQEYSYHRGGDADPTWCEDPTE